MNTRTIFILFFTICFSSIVFCQKNAEPISLTDIHLDKKIKRQSTPIVKGKIINATVEELASMKIEYTPVQLTGPKQVTETATIQPDGTFSIELLKIPAYQQIWFYWNDYAYTCLWVKDGLEITFDLQKIKEGVKPLSFLGEGVHFEGKDAEITTLYNQYIIFSQKDASGFNKKIKHLNDEDDNYLVQLDSLNRLKIDEFKKEHATSQNLWLIESNVQLAYNSKVILNHLFNLRKPLPSALLQKISQSPVYSVDNESREYLTVLSWYVKQHLYPQAETKDVKAINSELSKHFSLPYQDLIRLQFESTDLPEQLEIYKNYLPTYHTKWSKALVDQQILTLEKKVEKLRILSQAPPVRSETDSLGTLVLETTFDAKLFLNNHIRAEDILQKIKKRFTNKLIIIDIWATWCGPCMQQMPKSKQLHHEAKENNLPVEFVYLCTSGKSSQEKWKNKVLELEQPGTHLFVDNELINQLFNIFNRSGYPTYIAIKPNGEIDTKSIRWISEFDLEKIKKLID